MIAPARDRTTRPVAAFLGTSGGVCFSRLGFDRALERAGLNLGNLLFQYAFWESVDNPKFDYYFFDGRELDGGALDVLVLPAANQLNPEWDMGWWADVFERVDRPIVVAGLGAQVNEYGDPRFDLPAGTVRFVRTLARYAKTIGVRGPFTQEVLACHGVHNTVVTGCPSNFISPRVDGPSIAAKIARVRQDGAARIGYLFGTMEACARPAEAILLRMAEARDADIIHQTNAETLRFLHAGDLSAAKRESLEWERAELGSSLGFDEYVARLRRKGRFFSDARSWIDAAGRYDLCVGMRIHGAVAAIQGGGLGVCVAFDSRTLELSETMGYPHVLAEELRPGMDVRDLAGMIRFDAVAFDAKRAALRTIFRGLIAEAGLTPHVMLST